MNGILDGQEAVAEAKVLTTKLKSLGIDEKVTKVDVCGTSHIVFSLSGSARSGAITPVVPDLASALAMHRGANVQMRLRLQPSIALEANHRAPRALSWRNCTMNLYPGQMTFGRSYDGPIPRDWRTSFAKMKKSQPGTEHPHILIVGQTGAGKSNLLAGALLSAAWNSAPEKFRWHLIDLKNEDLRPFARLPHVASFGTTQTDAVAIVRKVVGLMEARIDTEVEPGDASHILIIDELAHLEIVDELEPVLSMGRSKKIHILAATQTPTQRLIGAKQNYALRLVGAVTDAQTAALASGRRNSGAESLPRPGQFLAVDANVERLVAYHWPSDAVRSMVQAIIARWGDMPPEVPAQLPPQLPPLRPVPEREVWEQDGGAMFPVRNRALSLDERDEVRRLAALGWSKNKIVNHVYGGKNSNTLRWIGEALQEAEEEFV